MRLEVLSLLETSLLWSFSESFLEHTVPKSRMNGAAAPFR